MRYQIEELGKIRISGWLGVSVQLCDEVTIISTKYLLYLYLLYGR